MKFDGISVGVGEMKIDSLSLRSDEYFDHRSDGKDGMIYEFDYDLYHRSGHFCNSHHFVFHFDMIS